MGTLYIGFLCYGSCDFARKKKKSLYCFFDPAVIKVTIPCHMIIENVRSNDAQVIGVTNRKLMASLLFLQCTSIFVLSPHLMTKIDFKINLANTHEQPITRYTITFDVYYWVCMFSFKLDLVLCWDLAYIFWFGCG